ncbi:MAG: fused MFS/spermidine synthase [Pseudomonadales bacterium]
MFVGVLACFFLSGFAALVYQMAWLREFTIAFGTSEVAVATVLAAYMGGLALGSIIAAQTVSRLRRPVLAYGFLEAGIAASALAVPAMISGASVLLVALIGGQPSPPQAAQEWQPLVYLAIACLVLLVPTALMGATLPMLIRHAVRDDRQLGWRIAILYATNTMGAVVGTLVAGFLLLPRMGLNSTVLIGIAANTAVFLIAALISRFEVVVSSSNHETSTPSPPADSGAWWLLPVMAVSGAVSFTYEVLWTRLLNHVLGGTVYAFATMLASFLLGIALGSALASRFASQRSTAMKSLAFAQLAIAASAAAVYGWLQAWEPISAGLSGNAVHAGLVMLSATVFIGATYPLAVRVLAGDEQDAGSASARIYAWNTLGAIAGAMLAGFVLIPVLHFEGTTRWAVIVNLALALVIAAAAKPRGVRGIVMPATLGLVLLAALSSYEPKRPMGVLDVSIVDDTQGGREVYYAVGRSATVLLKEHDGAYLLRTNGLPEATIWPRGAPPSPHSQRWLTTLPLLSRPETNDMLVIGLGGGVALERIPPSVRRITVVELEPEVLEANRRLVGLRAEDPLSDPRIEMVLNDARGALRLTNASYDVVVSQPSHPWTAGASHLYTREFVGLVAERLRPGGVFVQWINSQFLDPDLLRALAATLLEEFPHVELYQPQPEELLFLASTQPIAAMERFSDGSDLPETLRQRLADDLAIVTVEDLVVALALDETGVRRLAAGAKPVTDDLNRMAFFSRPDATGMGYRQLLDLIVPFDPLLRVGDATLPQDLKLRYVGQRMIERGFEARALRWVGRQTDPAVQFALQGHGLEYHGRRDEADEAYRLAVRIAPDNEHYRYLAIRSAFGALASGTADAPRMAIAARLSGTPNAVLAGWRAAMAGDWLAVARLDPQLAKSNPSDPWFPDAVKLRADWRARVDAGPRTTAMLAEARNMLNRELLASPSLDLLVIRAAVAVREADPTSLVECGAAIARQVRSKLDRERRGTYLFTPVERSSLKRRLFAVEQQIRRLSGQSLGSSSRAATVVAELQELHRAL